MPHVDRDAQRRFPLVEIRRLTPSDEGHVQAATHLFDTPPVRELTTDFLGRRGHHLLIAAIDRHPVGFVTGMEIAHPDKALEMMLYELGVDENYRRRGVGRALVAELASLAREVGCTGMWVPVEAHDDRAVAFYQACGAANPEPAATLWWDLA
jgi:ribosomal protein S18 acetylase RimI-like enzyme